MKEAKEISNKDADGGKEHDEKIEDIDKVRFVQERAIELFKSGIVENMMVNTNGKVEMPIRVFNPEGGIHSWFVGVTIEDKIVGFMRFDTELRFLSYSAFIHQSRPLDSCPLAKVWLDPDTIVGIARTIVPEDELMEPFLSYDRSPARIAWIVRCKEEGGKVGTIYVIGEYVYKVLDEEVREERPGYR